ncbi:hypothetical protein BDV93DRAFT_131746, partial [Ceratobasidium sp. AG-I]
ASGKQYPAELIPKYLAPYRPSLNPKSVKRTIKIENERLAWEHWATTKAGAKQAEKNPDLVAHSHVDRTRHLPRARAALLLQLTTGHAPLRSHLFRLKAVDSPQCQYCNSAAETTAHFLLRCQSFAAERHTRLASRGLEFLLLSFLFSSDLALGPLFGYIKATGCFPDLA